MGTHARTTQAERLVSAVLAVLFLLAVACKESSKPGTPQPSPTPAISSTPAPTPAGGQAGAGAPPPGFTERAIEQKVSRVRADMRSLAVATEAYMIDWNSYPEFVVSPKSGLPTHRFAGGLTTPIAYLTHYLADPFAPTPNAIYVYWKSAPGRPSPSGALVPKEQKGIGWIAVSAGPDGDYDLAGEWDAFNPTEKPPLKLLTGKNKRGSAFTYDPTNGLGSDGDIWASSIGAPGLFAERAKAGHPSGESIHTPPRGTEATPGQVPENQIAQRVSGTRSNMRSMATAIEAYYIDNNRYPAFAIGEKSINHKPAGKHEASQMPSFRLAEPNVVSLIKPMSYILNYPADLFYSEVTFAYWSVFPGQPGPGGKLPGDPAYSVGGVGWILVSPGPDGDYDLLGEWDVYNPGVAQPSKRLLGGVNKKGSAFTYDPTNGLMSGGDLWRVKQ